MCVCVCFADDRNKNKLATTFMHRDVDAGIGILCC